VSSTAVPDDGMSYASHWTCYLGTKIGKDKITSGFDENTGGPNVLGSDGTYVHKVPSYGVDRKSCETGHVAAATGSWSSSPPV